MSSSFPLILRVGHLLRPQTMLDVPDILVCALFGLMLYILFHDASRGRLLAPFLTH